MSSAHCVLAPATTDTSIQISSSACTEQHAAYTAQPSDSMLAACQLAQTGHMYNEHTAEAYVLSSRSQKRSRSLRPEASYREISRRGLSLQ